MLCGGIIGIISVLREFKNTTKDIRPWISKYNTANHIKILENLEYGCRNISGKIMVKVTRTKGQVKQF